MNKKQLLTSLKSRGFSEEILNAFSNVKREDFLSKSLKKKAYDDTALPLEKEQTISQPYTIAVMLDLLNLDKTQKVLEIGSGSGYVLALLSEIVGKEGEVFGIEIIKELYEKSLDNLKPYKNIGVVNRNGIKGLLERAPFDRILISAASYKGIPKSLVKQLKIGGIIVAPVGNETHQSLVCLKRTKSGIIKHEIPGFIFVPLIE